MAINPGNPDDGPAEIHEINVTPFIDVMLVLLIIFMVAAPLSTVDVDVDLPASSASAAQPTSEPINVTLKKDLSLEVAGQAADQASLRRELEAATGGDRDIRIFLRADRSVAYGDLMALMNLLREAGYPKVALVGVETPDEGRATPP